MLCVAPLLKGDLVYALFSFVVLHLDKDHERERFPAQDDGVVGHARSAEPDTALAVASDPDVVTKPGNMSFLAIRDDLLTDLVLRREV